MQLSENFKLSEFTDYSVVQLDPVIITNLTRLALALETIRTYFNDNQIIINSGYRDPAHNSSVGGVSNSQHLYGLAADFTIENYTPYEVQAGLRVLKNRLEFPLGGLGLYDTFTHFDIRGYYALWDKTKDLENENNQDIKNKNINTSFKYVGFSCLAFGIVYYIYSNFL